MVNHIDKPVFSCECEGRTIVTDMGGAMHGTGALSETKRTLTDTSLLMIRSMIMGVAGIEFFKEGKKSIEAKDLVVEDESTKRKFSFTITAKEI